MSARPEIPAEDAVTIEIDGQSFQARKGAMIIEVADEAGISIPRFCYHKKLSVAANCRMCMVEVEKVPKPLPACATPVADGMRIFTKSDLAKGAQKAIMEFLLINHPLDCPICDQGGECELQDLALGYGGDVSRFAEKKRVVKDKFIGPLIATDMTRCIHCTRCIRMLREVAGKMELGATGRGENMEIGTYIEKSIESELSGNVIDVCPVGALTSKPFRFKARAWELQQHPTVAPHDSIGSNIFMHTRRGEALRVVPRENESINEVWISDRDRFSYEGLYSEDRIDSPMVRVDGEWQPVDWETGLQAAVDGIRGVIDSAGADQVGVLVSPTATIEEMSLLQALARGIGVNNIDHRLRQTDFTADSDAPQCPTLGQSIEALEAADAILLVGANPRKEQPIAGHRIRKAAMKGAKVIAINPLDYEFLFDAHAVTAVAPSKLADALAAVAACFPDAATKAGADAGALIAAASPDDDARAMADALKSGQAATVLLGNSAVSNPRYSALKAIAGVICEASGATLGILPEAANSTGAWLAGVVPHRGPTGSSVESVGMNAGEMIDSPRKAYLLLGVEPARDCYNATAATAAMTAADCVVVVSAFTDEATRECADVLLPIGPFTETSGTFVNAEGRWQSFKGVASPHADSRPGWKVLRVLGNQFGLDGFDQDSSEQIRDALRGAVGDLSLDNMQPAGPIAAAAKTGELERVGDVAIYSSDALVRRAPSLQKTPDALGAGELHINSKQAGITGVMDGYRVKVSQGGAGVEMDVVIDERVPTGCVRMQGATAQSAQLGGLYAPVTVERV